MAVSCDKTYFNQSEWNSIKRTLWLAVIEWGVKNLNKLMALELKKVFMMLYEGRFEKWDLKERFSSSNLGKKELWWLKWKSRLGKWLFSRGTIWIKRKRIGKKKKMLNETST